MKKRTKITLWSILFVIVFTVSALIRVNMLGSAPMKLMQIKWDDTVGTIYNDLNYENDYGHMRTFFFFAFESLIISSSTASLYLSSRMRLFLSETKDCNTRLYSSSVK